MFINKLSFFKNNESDWKKSSYRLIVFLSFAYFAFKIAYFSLNINPSVPPDEVTHYARVIEFSKVLFIPHDSPETYKYGLIGREPYLYYLLFAKFLKLNFFGMSTLIFIRLLNALTGFCTVIVAFAWFRTLTCQRIAHLLFLIMLTNTLMFTFLCGSVNYDNFVNLLSILSIFFLSRFFQKHKLLDLLLTGCMIFAGALTKITFVPFTAIILIVLFFHGYKSHTSFRTWIKKRPIKISATTLVSAILLFILSVGTIELYGVNLLRYKKLVPDFDQVLTLDQAMQFRIFARNKIFDKLDSGKITYDEALKETSVIKSATGDSISTVNLILNKKNQRSSRPMMDRLTYIPFWLRVNIERTYGILAHLNMLKNDAIISLYTAFLISALLIFLRKWQMTDANGIVPYLFAIFVSYILVVMQYAGYSSDKYFGLLGMELQGRYTFPVLPILYGIIAMYVLRFRTAIVHYAIFLAVSILFITGDIPFFLANAYKDWFIH